MNQKMLEVLQGDASKYPKFIEAHFPHVFEKLLEYWGTYQMHAFLDDLMLSRRPGRQGFPPEAAAEIWVLSSFYAKHYPDEAVGLGTDVWQEDVEAVRADLKESAATKNSEDKSES